MCFLCATAFYVLRPRCNLIFLLRSALYIVLWDTLYPHIHRSPLTVMSVNEAAPRACDDSLHRTFAACTFRLTSSTTPTSTQLPHSQDTLRSDFQVQYLSAARIQCLAISCATLLDQTTDTWA